MTYDKNTIQFLSKPIHHNFRDLEGQRFNRLTALGLLERRNKKLYWLCECVCGNLVAVWSVNLTGGQVQSCGCLRNQRVSAALTTHGHSRHPLFSIWDGMIRRCHDPSNKSYKMYGGRGIIVDTRWHQIENFIADMGERPSKLHSVERVDNAGNYTPHNCQWAVALQQNRNTRRNKLVTYQNRTQCLIEWANELGINPVTLHHRLYRSHWTIEEAFTVTVRHGNRITNIRAEY